jgi:hypothetical protein
MAKANWLNQQFHPSWNDVLLRLQVIKDHPGDRSLTLCVDDDDDDYLIVYFTAYGFLVQVHGSGEPDFFALVDNSRGNETMSVWCASDTISRPRRFFVDEHNAMQAVRYYFEMGEKDPELTWEINNTI